MWSSWPWLKKMPSTSGRLSSRYEMSGRTRSMPSMSSWGNMRPASTTRIWSSHSRAQMLMPTSPRPPSGRYLRRDPMRGPREVTAKPLTSWGFSQEIQLLCLLLWCRGGWRRRRRRRSQELVQVLLHPVEVVLQVRDEGAVMKSRSRVVERHVRHVAPTYEAAVDA